LEFFRETQRILGFTLKEFNDLLKIFGCLGLNRLGLGSGRGRIVADFLAGSGPCRFGGFLHIFGYVGFGDFSAVGTNHGTPHR